MHQVSVVADGANGRDSIGGPVLPRFLSDSSNTLQNVNPSLTHTLAQAKNNAGDGDPPAPGFTTGGFSRMEGSGG